MKSHRATISQSKRVTRFSIGFDSSPGSSFSFSDGLPAQQCP
jgi:hypothetical protein